ncbi:receptor-like protein 36 [Cryptomeria japonica]|uniref:receptor-like protein 36 n=1 Tax=Cryptomeria japonica TaxID=3369 RepID=UPI0027DA26AD|nr:receptor-like protein 36 [Cryptomeria japonica]
MAPGTARFLLFAVIPLCLLPLCCGCIHSEREALLQFKDALNFSSHSYLSPNLSSWEKGRDCCLWDGISCHNTTHHVVAVEIQGVAFPGMEGGVISESLCSLTSLATIRVFNMGLKGTLPPCFGNLSSLRVLDFSYNNLEGETVLTTICLLSNLSEVDLSYNQLKGSLPSCLGNLSSLIRLYIPANHLIGEIPYSLGKISSLKYFDVSTNSIGGRIPESLGSLSLLETLDLSDNQLIGTLPSSFSRLTSLAALYVCGNAFNQSIASSTLPPSLQHLGLSLDGQHIISEDFFQNLSKLECLTLSNCVLNISTTWIPSFQLFFLYMLSCKVDGQIPLWISTQSSLLKLELYENNLFGEIPLWLMDMNLLYINLSSNHLQGRLLLNTSPRNPLAVLDVSRNALSGQIPSIWPPDIKVLLVNDNLLTGNIPLQLQGISSLEIVNLANNYLNGIIPPSLANCSELKILNLEDNNLRGMIPYELGKLSKLKSLVIKKNQLSGSFPPSISNCTELYFLDVGQNFFSGHIPKLIGNLSELKVLAMRKNKYEGSIPVEITQLENLQVLDLSSNQLSGIIPHTIFSLQAMLTETHQEFSMVQYEIFPGESPSVYPSTTYMYKNGLTMNSKGRDEHYTYIFPTMAAIDLSDNQLNGDLPSDLGKLKGLKLLNLSMNNFNGVIPNSIVQMIWLESLDLSANHFSGQIPLDLGSLSYLGALNFSNNHLSGSIPQGGHMTTFNNLSYLGNPNLWGCPLSKKCCWPEFFTSPPPISTYIDGEEHNTESLSYEIGLGFSYVAGFTIVLAFIVMKRKWGHKYFEGIDLVLKFFFPWIRNLTL